ncbi:non-ribosomal peptide synthetase/MFS transporter [Pseudonocardia sp. KRD291]|uniref:non-ribosomal peptide synthetase/MFS transporter n=1 Tax=Pseudonocardia sp. KRD291 TaxID=2792007 RepID=UPI001C4A4F19|nr:non-ribosomal peptide synthetase/MFS transporter [Pseudonocardia sp. KRD291]MBW0102230.1 amino acid adenylation domain-containing protein [Pseudonocardia sp. KRD291]
MTRTCEPPRTVDDDVWSSVAAQAARTPRAVALADADGELDYEGLVALVAETADRLRGAGVRAGDLVGVALPRGRDAVVAVLAVLRTGAGYVPLDPVYPRARLDLMISETSPRALVTADGVVPVEGGVPQPDPAYVIFTSGSTGRPKGVLVGRRSLRDFCRAFADRFAFAEGDRVLQFASLSFDVSVEEIFPPLTRGATVVLRDDDMISRPDLFLDRCGALGVTVLDLPTAYWHELVAALDQGEATLPPCVRCVIVGGETARPDAVRRWQRAVRGSAVRLFNTYGPTETTVGATAADVSEWSGDVVPIGAPLPGVTCRVSDDGELLVGGIGVAQGYLNRPELTAERFVTAPGGAREYRTGDRVRWSGGQLEFLGRLDDQVKIRGHRVEPGEVEAALREMPAVADAVVLVDDRTGRARLVGHVVTGAGTDLAAVRAALAGVLPAHLVPAVLIRHPRLPLNPQGKVDKAVLAAAAPPEQAPETAGPARTEPAGTGPATDQEAAAALVEEVLGVAVTSADDDFLTLGGDSLDAVRLIAALRRRHGAELTLTRWYADPTVAALAAVIAGAVTGADGENAVAGLAEGVAHRLSPMQRDYWIAEQLCAGLPVYTLGIRYHWAGPVDVSALRSALGQLSRRHPLLRARFPDDGTEPSMVIEPAGTIPLTPGEPDRRAIDIRQGPIAHAFLDGDGLVLVVHHLAFDGWSAGVLGHDLAALYRAALHRGADDGDLSVAAGLPPGAPAPDLAARSAGARADPALVAYWRDRFAGADLDLELPTDRPAAAARSHAAARVTRRLDPDLLGRLRSYAGGRRASLFVVVLAGLQVVLRRYTGRTDVTVLSPVAGRSTDDMASLVGPALNVLPMRGDVAGEPTFAELVARVRDAVLADLDHQDLALPDLVHALARPGAAKRMSPVMLTVHNTPGTDDPILQLAGDLAPAATMVDLAVGLDLPADGAVLTADYATELFDGARVEAFLDHLLTVLDAATTNTPVPVTRLPMITEAERARIVHDWNDVVAEVPDATAVHEVFQRRAAATPDAPALTVGGDTLSYGELNRRANRMARRLRREGVGPGHRVAIRLDRGAALFTAMWAVLKAGGAYVPLDPAYPPERLEHMLADSRPTVVVDGGFLAAADPADLADDSDPDSDLPTCNTADDPAYVIYTSGSTGRPKGVVVTHANLVHAAGMWREAYALRPEWTYLQAASFSFDMFVGETLRAHTSGGRLVVAPRETLLDPADLLALMTAEQVNCTELVPAVLRALLEHARGSGRSLDFVHLLIGGGEKWQVREYALARSLVGPGNRVVNSYGVTEVTVDNVLFDGSVEHLADDAPLPIGRPFPNNRVYVLDAYRRPVPAGVVGELYLGGLGVGPGYHDRPALTAERFVPDPFAGVAGARMYRTGDSARFHRDGTVDFLGRLDDQVKVNGYRIELGEVEAALGLLPQVTACAASVHQRPDGLAQLVGHVVTRDGTDADEAAARDVLAAGLAPQMVPARILTLPALPLTPNGKLDRRRLPAPPQGGPDAAGTPPGTATEKRVAAAWSAVLGVDGPSIDDSFFALGGDSFAALKVVRRIEPTPSLVDFYRHATIRRLAAHLDDRSPDDPAERRLLHRLTATGADPAAGGHTVVAVPYSGGSAVAFAPVAEALPAHWALHAVELPGHDRARPDEELEPISVVADRIVAEMRELDGPVLLYGHCLGVALTVEVGRRAEAAGVDLAGIALGAGFPTARLPGRFFDWFYRHVPVDWLTSDREYLAYLRARGGFTDLDDAEQKAFVLRNVRHDARDAEEYFTAAYRGGYEPLTAPVLAVVGARDRVTEHHQERHHEWRHFTGGEVGVTVLPEAGHFFVRSHAEPLAGALVDFVDGPGPAPAPPEPAAEPERPQAPATPPSLRRFAVVAAGQLLSMVGSGLSTLVLSIWVFEQTGSVTDFAVVSAIGLLPGILAGPFAGAVADRWNRRTVMLASDSAAGLAMAVLAGLMLSDGLHLWHVYLAVTVTSVAGAFQRPAYLAAVAQLVPKRYLGHAGGIGQLGVGVGLVFAPMLGAALIGPIGIGGVLLVDMGTFAVGTLTLLCTRFPNLMFRRREEGFGAEIRNGWRYITRRPGLRAALRFFVIDHAFYTLGFAVITPMLLVEQSAAVLGLALGAGGVGGLTGAVLMSLWGGTARRSHGMLVFMGVGSLAMVLVGVSTEPALVIAAMFLVGFGETLADGHWIAIVQSKVGLELQGRVLSLFITLMMLTMPLGYLVVGPLAERHVQPLLQPGGALVDTVGQLTGTGPGRGLALLIVLSGLLQLAWAVRGWCDARLRLIEDELPDAVPPERIGTRDDLQREADELLTAPVR